MDLKKRKKLGKKRLKDVILIEGEDNWDLVVNIGWTSLEFRFNDGFKIEFLGKNHLEKGAWEHL